MCAYRENKPTKKKKKQNFTMKPVCAKINPEKQPQLLNGLNVSNMKHTPLEFLDEIHLQNN